MEHTEDKVLLVVGGGLSRPGINRAWLPTLPAVRLTVEETFSLSPFALENFDTGDRFDHPVPRQSVHCPYPR